MKCDRIRASHFRPFYSGQWIFKISMRDVNKKYMDGFGIGLMDVLVTLLEK